MLGLGRVPVYVPARLQTQWLLNEENITRIGHIVQQTISCTEALKGARQAKHWAQEKAQDQLQAARAANRLFEKGISHTTAHQRQALSWLDDAMIHATNNLQAELDVDVLKIWKVLYQYKSVFAGVVFKGEDPHVWEQDFGAAEFSPRMYHCLDQFKLYFQELAAWGAKTRVDKDRLATELEETKQALKEATALLAKVAVPALPVDFVPTPQPSTTKSASRVATPLNPGADPFFPRATHSNHAGPTRIPHVQPTAPSAEQPVAQPIMQPLIEPAASLDSQVVVVEDAMGKAVFEPVTKNEVGPFVEVELEGRREVVHEVVPVVHVDLGEAVAVQGSEVRPSEPVQDVLGVGSAAVTDHECQVVSEPEVEAVVQPAVSAAVQPESAAALVSVVDTAAHSEVQQAQNTLSRLYQQYQLQQGSSGPAVPGVGKCPAGFFETTVTTLEAPALQPTPLSATAATEPAELGVPAEPAVVMSETALVGGDASSDGFVLGSPSVGSTQPKSPAWAISAQHEPGADLLQDSSPEDEASSATDPDANSVTAQGTPHPLPAYAETMTNAHRPGIDSQHAQHAETATSPPAEAMHAAKAWALPILRKIKGSPAGVEELWHTLHNSPRTEALAICEATLGKSTQVASFVADFLGRVSQDTPDDDVGAMNADPAPSALSKSQRRRLRKKAARAALTTYPSPQALEAAKGWAVPVLQHFQGGSTEGVAEFWKSLQSTPVTEIGTLCEDRLGASSLVTGFVKKLLRSISSDEDEVDSVATAPKLTNAEKRTLRRWSKQQSDL